MSRVVKNQSQMRASTRSGSPKKKAAWRSFSNRNGGINPGLVSTYQAPNTSTSTNSCQSNRFFELGRSRRHISVRLRPLRVTLEHFVAQNLPDRAMQLDELRQHTDFCDVPRPRQVDFE